MGRARGRRGGRDILAKTPDGEQPDVQKLFATLSLLARSLTAEASDVGLLDEESFDKAFDHLVIVRPEPNLWRCRFEFCGSTVADTACAGDVTGLTFGDILSDSITPAVLDGYGHAARTRSANVTRNFTLVHARPRLFTRFILPLFHRERVALMLSAVVIHQEPLPAAAQSVGVRRLG